MITFEAEFDLKSKAENTKKLLASLISLKLFKQNNK